MTTLAATGMAALLLLGWLAVLIGVGALIAPALRIPVSAPVGLLGWVGVSVVTMVALIAHLWMPLASPWLAAGLALAALIGWLRRGRRGGRLSRPRRGVLGAVIAGAAVLLGNLSLAVPDNPDSLQYHLGQVAYNAGFPVVPGLAALSHRMGFDSAGHVFGAALLPGDLALSGLSLQVPLLCLLLIVDALQRLLSQAPRRLPTGSLLLILAASYGLLDVLRLPATHLASPSPDATALVVAMAAIGYLALALESTPPRSLAWPDAAAALLLTALLATIRPLFYLAAVVALTVLLWRLGVRAMGRLWAAAGLAAALMLLSLGHRTIISGMPLFPAGPRIGVDWLVSADIAAAEAAFIGENARHPGLSPDQAGGLLGWLLPWLARAPYVNLGGYLIALLTLAGLITCAIWLVGGRAGLPHRAVTFTLAAAPWLVSLLGWFLIAPDLRFAWGAIIGLVLLGAAVLLQTPMRRLDERTAMAVIGAIVIAGAGLTLQSMVVAKSGFPVTVGSWQELGWRGVSTPATRRYPLPAESPNAGGTGLTVVGPVDPEDPYFSCATILWCGSRAPIGIAPRGEDLRDGFRLRERDQQPRRASATPIDTHMAQTGDLT